MTLFSFSLLEHWLVSFSALAMTLRFVGKVVFSKEFDSTWLATWRESPNNISLFISQTRPSQICVSICDALLSVNLTPTPKAPVLAPSPPPPLGAVPAKLELGLNREQRGKPGDLEQQHTIHYMCGYSNPALSPPLELFV